MTEAEWFAGRDPTALLNWVVRDGYPPADPARAAALDRRFLLYAVGCVRRLERHLTERGRSALELGERRADGPVTDDELRAASQDLGDGSLDRIWGRGGRPPDPDAVFSANERVERATGALIFLIIRMGGYEMPALVRASMASERAAEVHRGLTGQGIRRERAVQAALARDVFGNPFRPVAFDPDWRTATAFALARTIYEDRTWDRLPVLADALEDAGCADAAAVLGHLRGPGPHVRGCWVVDLVLGKS